MKTLLSGFLAGTAALAMFLPAGPAYAERKDIVDTAIAAGQFQTLLTAAKAADLVDTLRGPGPYTVFAPTDAAFAKLPAGTVDKLLKDKATLRRILLHHVVPARKGLSTLSKQKSDTTADGGSVALRMAGKTLMVGGTAKVIKADIETSNGNIHVIDTVLQP